MGAVDICCNWHYNNCRTNRFLLLNCPLQTVVTSTKVTLLPASVSATGLTEEKKISNLWWPLVSLSTVKLHTFNFRTKLHFAHFQIPSCTLQKHRLSHHMACWGLDHIAHVSLCSAEAGVHYNGEWCVLFCSHPYLLYESADINEHASFLP